MACLKYLALVAGSNRCKKRIAAARRISQRFATDHDKLPARRADAGERVSGGQIAGDVPEHGKRDEWLYAPDLPIGNNPLFEWPLNARRIIAYYRDSG